MKPTKAQLKFLRAWLLFHHSGFTFGNWFRLNWKALLIVALLLVFSALIALAIPLVGGILFGLYLGTLLRDITYFRIARRRWVLATRLRTGVCFPPSPWKKISCFPVVSPS